ncbi:hypothetical protein IW140_002395 [Coemansia sp. RSA 1813]|nr:hypothetical protein EV178_000895 [Coemansia sp. RSA 1646]KAJ1772999.1 hypothetical protein LPJ74_000950 [Coemansia sp. RSA 1843]KAJ2092224.1 hypothetical protein IW138_001291 [Coemansia sp. RSA 986]KAJ2211342.1 hypothetical protein EV179_005570 [Coemansia sp. RSA 487]KAJ2570302.1 hypothetical protein IW140_002395 [Coemansia sp. RSA 1813]
MINGLIKRSIPLVRRTPSLQQSKAAASAMALHTKIDLTVESKHLSPTEFHNYLKSRDGRELKEFLSEESEIVAMDSFNDPPSYQQQPSSESTNIDSKDLNEQFKKQIHDLLYP